MQADPAELYEDDPLEALTKRDPLPRACGVRAIVVAEALGPEPLRIALGLGRMLAKRGRPWDARVVSPTSDGFAEALALALEDAKYPLILVTTATAPWTDAHLDPLLATIDQADHALGVRETSWKGRWKRWFKTRIWRWVFAVPITDVRTPCRLHRLKAFAALPLQSDSGFLDVEVLAKATFLTQVVAVEGVPPLPAWTPPVRWSDIREVFNDPQFKRPEPTTVTPDPDPQPA